MSSITWLHLSDLHFRSGSRKTDDARVVLDALLKYIRRRMAPERLRPNFIAVTGDIGYSGKTQEYTSAARFLEELLEITDVPKEHLLVVPGNHDVNLDAITIAPRAIAASLNNRQALGDLLASDLDRRLMYRRLDDHTAFVKDFLGEDRVLNDEHLYYTTHLEVGGTRVAVLGLNSAWLCTGSDDDYGHLALGEYVVRQALADSAQAHLRIALMHHSFDWLLEFDRADCEDLLMDGCSFILHGHLHRPGMHSLSTPDAGAMVIANGATYDTRERPNNCNWVRLDLATGRGTVHLHTYSDRGCGFWTKDTQTYRNAPEGEFAFELRGGETRAARKGKAARGTKARKRVRRPSADPTQMEALYLRRVQETANVLPLAIIDPRAVERTQQQTMDLLAVYIALDTRTSVPESEKDPKARKRAHREERASLEGALAGRDTRQLSALQAISRDRQVVLLGDPGSGKSTFANYVALCLAGARLESLGKAGSLPGAKWLDQISPQWVHGPLLPLTVVLRDYAKSGHCDGTAKGLWTFVVETLESQNLSDFTPRLEERLREGQVIVLLDGLDEVADPGKLQATRDAVSDFVKTYAPNQEEPSNRYLVTCRGYAYEDSRRQIRDFTTHILAPFNQVQIDAYIKCWYKEVCRLKWKTAREADDLTRLLQEASRRPDLAPLSEKPLQLAMMASLQFSWGKLPDDRVELYQEMVRLLLVRWQEARLGADTGITRMIGAGALESVLEQVAFVAHRGQQTALGTADVSEEVILRILKDPLQGSWDRACEIVKYIRERAGLLIERGTGRYTFPHRSYQEYLAGSYLARQPDFPDYAAKLARENYAQWREVVLWAVAVMARLKKITYIAVDVAEALCPQVAPGSQSASDDWQSARLAGEALLEIGVDAVRAREHDQQVLARVRAWLMALLERGGLTPADRAASGRVLASLGDERRGVGLRPDGLPEMAWCEVPGGPFIMGSDKTKDPEAFDDEIPQHEEESVSQPYLVAKYLVTNAQFAAFVKAGGYSEGRYWREAKDAGLWKLGKVKGSWDHQAREAPYGFGSPFNLPNHPVVGITWFEALAFCRWLTHEYRKNGSGLSGDAVNDSDLKAAVGNGELIVRLPTEAQWEKAARGSDGRVYPWGKEITPDHGNYSGAEINSTSAVGMFPLGVSPFGAMDMAGNVWEWCGTKWTGDYADYKENVKRREMPGGQEPRVVRGGSWYHYRKFVRCASRLGGDPDNRGSVIGFRVVGSFWRSASGL